MDEILLRNLFRNVDSSTLDDAQKVLLFYKLAIELERMKEPDIKEYYEYPINYHTNEHIMLIDFPCNDQFYQIFERNRNQRETKFPSDLYIGLKIKVGDETYRLLNMVIDYNEIKTIYIEEELLPVRIADFEVNLKEASRLELLPEKIDSINAGIKANPTWQGVLATLKKEISKDATVTDKLYLALSSKSIELSQIYSELSSKRIQSYIGYPIIRRSFSSTQQKEHNLLKSFLLNESIENKIDDIDADGLLCVTQLDDSQKQAVANAMNSRVSVITGAPGTGKTQVIENILANALIQGKKVLVSSKNNKAVDNVKDRFDDIDPTGYLLRFGSRQVVSQTTMPAIERIITEIGQLKDNTATYEDYKSHYTNSVQTIKNGKEQLAKVTQLKNALRDIASRKANAEQALRTIESSHNSNVEGIRHKYEQMLPLSSISANDLNKYLTTIRTLENNLTAKFTGFFGFWHRIFSVKKSTAKFLNEIENFPIVLKTYASDSHYGLTLEMSDFKSHHILLEQIKKWSVLIKNGISYKQELSNENDRYMHTKRNAERTYSQLANEERQKNQELTALNNSIPTIQSTIADAKRWIQSNSLGMLKAYIQYKKQKSGAVRDINGYKSYLPDQIPWKDEEYSRFVQRTKGFLDVFNLCAVTCLSTKNAFPLAPELFDMVVIDEASQCDIASALPLIMRTKQIVVIGDPMQLRHISAVKVDEEKAIKGKIGIGNLQYVKYAECSLYDYCKDFISNVKSGQAVPYMLRYHYRCYPSIINYSNDLFYGGVMGQRLEIKTDINQLKGNPQGIVLVNVVGKQINDNVNINDAEARKSIELAVQAAATYPDVTIGIVTPFRHQAERINSMIPGKYADRIEANTVHKYQGDEKDIMVYSLVVTSNSPDRKIYWIDRVVPNLVNVAVTRAKSTLYVVGNLDYIKSHSNQNQPLGYLVRYNN